MIDFHTHIFPEKIADKTISHLSEICGMPPYTNGKEQGLLASAKNAGIDCCIILPVATAPKQFDSIHRFALQFMEENLISFGSLHPDCEDYKEKLRWIKNNGFKGVKFHPDYQDTYFNDIKYKRMISYASELDLIMVTHAGRDPLSPDDVHCTPKMIEEVLDEVQPKNLVLAHMGGNEMFDEVEKVLVGRDVFFDTAYVLDKMNPDQFLRMVRNHGVEKILFGSDSPWGEQTQFVETFHKIPLTQDEREQIAWKNAYNLLKM